MFAKEPHNPPAEKRKYMSNEKSNRWDLPISIQIMLQKTEQ